MKIAVVGSGISGLTAAWRLCRDHQVTVFEADDRIGGHTHTHDVTLGGRSFRVDTGFIVFNRPNYPLFGKLLEELGVDSQPSDMSFAVRNDITGIEYNATNIRRLFARPSNALSPRFWQMIREIRRFYREAPQVLEPGQPDQTTEEYLAASGYSDAFANEHLIPMASALWSAPPGQIRQFPIRYMVQFFANHRMLQVDGRPEWRVIKGGSNTYVQRLLERLDAAVQPATPIAGIDRDADGVTLTTEAGDRFDCDAVVLACHSDQALAMLNAPSQAEREVLGAIGYQHNDVVLHTDIRLLPRRRAAWAAWNALVVDERDAPCTVSYDMNILQGLKAPEEFVVTLNRTERIDPERIIARMDYHHPIYSHETVAAQARKDEINGSQRTWYCGAYWGWGFHEDGVRSAEETVAALNREQPGA